VKHPALLACLLLSGCATLERPEEALWQTANAVDFSQTVNTARRPDCYHEGAFPTRLVLGEHPSTGAVLAFGAAYGLFHLAISDYLRRQVEETELDRWRALYWVWELGTLADTGHNVLHNHSIGLKPLGSGCQR